MPDLGLSFDWISVEDLEAALQIEQEGYPPDEAASFESFRLRQSQAGELFLGAYLPEGSSRELVGYVCSTLSPSKSLTHESMSTHVPNSTSVCIHSVCVSAARRNQKIGFHLLREYISRLEAAGNAYERILLITHEELRNFYANVGFELVGRSAVVHGSKPWYEMRRILKPSSSTSPTNPDSTTGSQTMPPGLFEALQRPSRSNASSKPFSSFAGGFEELTILDTNDQTPLNKYDLLCPRGGCASVILKKGVGKWVEGASVQLDPADHAAHPSLPALPTPLSTTQWWLVTPSPMQFENIGFSRPISSTVSSEAKIKLLICGECDLGPLGWSKHGSTEFWLACSRVNYAIVG